MNKQIAFLAMVILSASHFACTAQKELVYMGSYSQRDSKGISVYEFDRNTASFNLIQALSDFSNPNFLAIHPEGSFIYSIITFKGGDGANVDAVAALSLNKKDGKLTPVNKMSTHGKGACHISIDNTGKWLFVSHYTSGSLAVFPVNKDGSIGDTIQFIQNPTVASTNPRQKGPRVHSCLVSPDNKFVYVADLGTDKISIYSLNPKSGKLTPTAEAIGVSKPGSGPRHFTFHPGNSCFYVAEELSSTLTVFNRDAKTGALSYVQSVSTLPEGFTGRNSVADVHTSPDGKFIYVSNRGHNSIAIFSIKADGKVELLANEPVQGDHPRNFMIDPKGEYLFVANMNSDNVAVFKMDKATGLLKYSGTNLSIPAVVCLKWYVLK